MFDFVLKSILHDTVTVEHLKFCFKLALNNASPVIIHNIHLDTKIALLRA